MPAPRLDLITADPDGATALFEGLGWTVEDRGRLRVVLQDGALAALVHAAPDVEAHWVPAIQADRLDAVLGRLGFLGGEVLERGAGTAFVEEPSGTVLALGTDEPTGGTPVAWSTPDPDAARTAARTLFGWRLDGGLLKDGDTVVARLLPGGPPAWMPWVDAAVDDLKAAGFKVRRRLDDGVILKHPAIGHLAVPASGGRGSSAPASSSVGDGDGGGDDGGDGA